jgi:hypothetical protein
MFKMVRRKVPWILVFEAAIMLRARWRTLPRDERNRLTELARRSKGNPMHLTAGERRVPRDREPHRSVRPRARPRPVRAAAARTPLSAD